MQSFVIVINEIDDADDAVELLHKKLGRLGLPEKLKKNTFGIISTHADAVHSGVYKAICDELPFETAGFACDSQSPDGETGIYLLSVLILTSDDCTFACGQTDESAPVDEIDGQIKDCYSKLKQSLPAPPKLCLIYTPHKSEHFPGEYIEAISAVDTDVPIFGAVSIDVEKLVDGIKDGAITLRNGKSFNNSIITVLISGSINPQFFISSFTDDAVKMRNIGTITKCYKNVIEEINNKPATEFLKGIGFFGVDTENIDISDLKGDAGTATATLILDCGKKINVSRAFTGFTDKGGIACMGLVQEGAKISFAVSVPTAVTETTYEIIRNVQKTQTQCSGERTVLFYSCIGRRLGLLNNPMAEFDIIRTEMSEQCGAKKINYIATHCGGEISPVMMVNDNGKKKLFNCEHNQTLIACVL
jgi:hypothetical protein